MNSHLQPFQMVPSLICLFPDVLIIRRIQSNSTMFCMARLGTVEVSTLEEGKVLKYSSNKEEPFFFFAASSIYFVVVVVEVTLIPVESFASCYELCIWFDLRISK